MTWDDLTDYYIGQAGIKPAEFWKHTWKENALLGESWVINTNLEWEMFRFLGAMVYNTKVEKRAQMITPEKLFKLPQDIYLEKGKPKSTKEQYENFLKKISKTTIEKQGT